MTIEEIKERILDVKQKTVFYYGVAAQIYFGMGILSYLVCCMIAGDMVGPIRYVRFLGHICDWKGV